MIEAAGKDYKRNEIILYLRLLKFYEARFLMKIKRNLQGNFSESCQDMTPTNLRFESRYYMAQILKIMKSGY